MKNKIQKIIIILVLILSISGNIYLWSKNQSLQNTPQNDFSGVVKYNCEKSAGKFIGGSCVCSIEEELGQTQEMMYDKTTGYCQTTFGGPSGEAFHASIGLPHGDYGFWNNIIINNCTESGGEISGIACICAKGTIYDKSTGYCIDIPNNINLYQSKKHNIDFKYPKNWFVQEKEDHILISPDPTFDKDNEMIGENSPIGIFYNSETIIDKIIKNYNSTPENIIIADTKAQKISYTGLGQTFTFISIPYNKGYIEISKEKTDPTIDTAYEIILETLVLKNI